MGVAKDQVVSALSPPLPKEIIEHLIDEYQDIKKQFAFGKFGPSELNGGRFAECVMRLCQHINGQPYTPFGTSLGNTDTIIRQIENNTALSEAWRFFIPRLTRVLLDVRNRRDVAHVGGEVSPNYPDSVFVSHCADWILTEIIRIHYSSSIETARKIAESLNETQVPLVAEVDGFIRVQNGSLGAREKVLVILYHKNPVRVKDSDLMKWIRYSKSNTSQFKSWILGKLDADTLIHYENGVCTLLPKGIVYTEKHISMELLV